MPCINAVSYRFYSGIEPICRVIQEAGFDSIEVSRPHFYEQLTSRRSRELFREWAHRQGLALYGFDCWVEIEPFDAMEATLADFQKSVEFATDLDLGLVISHDTWTESNGERTSAEVMAANVELFRRCAEMTDSQGLKLVFEPHPNTLSMENKWCCDFIDAVAEGRSAGSVGVLFDLCHYGVGQPDTYLDAIPELGNRIQHLHFSDGDCKTYAQHLPLGDGCIDIAGAITALKQTDFRGTLTCDIFNYPLLEDGARRNREPILAVEEELGISPL